MNFVCTSAAKIRSLSQKKAQKRSEKAKKPKAQKPSKSKAKEEFVKMLNDLEFETTLNHQIAFFQDMEKNFNSVKSPIEILDKQLKFLYADQYNIFMFDQLCADKRAVFIRAFLDGNNLMHLVSHSICPVVVKEDAFPEIVTVKAILNYRKEVSFDFEFNFATIRWENVDAFFDVPEKK